MPSTTPSRRSRAGPATPSRLPSSALATDADEILVLTGDAPLLEPSLLAELLEERRLDEAAIALVAVDAIDPAQLGRVIRDEAGTVERIVERKDATDEEIAVNEINSGPVRVRWRPGCASGSEP